VMTWRPSPSASSRTTFQRFHLRLGYFITDARRDLDRREFETLVAILTALVARLNAERLDHEAPPT
jgi:hypothetical protein